MKRTKADHLASQIKTAKAKVAQEETSPSTRSIRKKLYGITQEQYQKMFDSQNGRCAICRRKPAKRQLGVDHKHISGRIRGLLCHRCNILIGMAHEKAKVLKSAVKYLEFHENPKKVLERQIAAL